MSIVSDFNKGDVVQTNESIAFLKRLNDYIVLARGVLTNKSALATLNTMEANSRELAMRIGKPEAFSSNTQQKTL